MCTREETRQEIELSERRMEAKITECITEVDSRIEGLDEKFFSSHNAISAVQSEMGATLIRLADKLEDFGQRFAEHDKKEIEYQNKVDAHLSQKQLSQENIEKLVDMVQDYTEKKVLEKSVNKLKNVLMGFAGVCAAVGVIMTSIIALIRYVTK